MFLAVLGLRCCVDFSLAGARRGLLCCAAGASHWGDFPCCRARALGTKVQWLWRVGSLAPQQAGSARTRNGTHVSCIDRRIPICWMPRGILCVS